MSEWISVKDRLPLRFTRVLLARGDKFTVGFLSSDGAWSESDGWTTFWQPTHWQPRPEPPPQQSSFETYWEKNRVPVVAEIADCPRLGAKKVWDAAIAASKSPDYVP